ncbi:hypothetical protein ABW636_08395 [Aquimarina sp. 2201CG1-2-11]|uniref:hypothetical protein n=1 Tax=Aquimarina discodermiae TaxID=3231043 RepID=UPI0034632F94
MKKIILILTILGLGFTMNGQHQTIGLNYSFGHNPSGDKFTFDGKSIGNYSLGWYATPTAAEALLSGYGGIKFFTERLPRMTITRSGNLGIGIVNPTSKFHIYSNTSSVSSDAGVTIEQNGTGDAQLQYLLTGVQRWVTGIDNSDGDKFIIGRGTNWVQGKNFVLDNNGNVGIGTSNPGSWKLAVNGNIRAKEIKVETGWSDFVFYENYKLPTLEEVETHIAEKGHLKDIPSAKEVAKNGIFLGEMDSKLLQKIEELTLYTIQQQKEIQNLKEENEELKSMAIRLTRLEKLLESKK